MKLPRDWSVLATRMKYVVSLMTLKADALYELEPVVSVQPLGAVRLLRIPPI